MVALSYLQLCFCKKIENALTGFTVPQPHHVSNSPPQQLPPALLTAKFVFVREDASILSLAPLYRGPYLVLERKDNFFRLQIVSRTDVVSVDCLKLAFLEGPIQAASPPAQGCSTNCPALCAADPPPSSTTSATIPARGSVQKVVRFKLPPTVPPRRNPHRTVCDRRTCSAIPPLLLNSVIFEFI